MAPGRYLSLSGVTDHGLVQLLEEARTLLGDTDSPLLAQVLARLGIELYWSEREQAVTLCQQAADMARRLDDPHTLIVALWGRWHSLRNPDSLEQRLADTREVIALAEHSGERDFALEARFWRVADLLEAGDIVGADVAQREYMTLEAELRDRFKRGLLLEGMRALMDGRLEEFAEFGAAGFRSRPAERASPRAQLVSHPARQNVVGAGSIGELESTLRGFIAQNPLIVFARCALQLILLEQGRPDEARVEFDRLAEGEFRLVQRDWNWIPSMFVLADVCADLGDAENAEILYRLLSPYASHNAMLGNVYTYGSVAFALGRLAAVLGRQDDATAHFETALAANRRIRAAVWLGHTQYEFAKALLKRNEAGDRARARTDRVGPPDRKRLVSSAFDTSWNCSRPRARATAPGLIEGVAALEARLHLS